MSQQSDLSEKKLLMNIVPLYGRVQNDNIIPGGQYASERPALYNNWDTMQKGYKALIYATIDDYISQGYAVETLPFTPMDHVAAKILLKGLKVHHHPFCPDPYRVFTRIQTASVFFASRYHATIFGLKANVNIIPFAYAKKNEQLLNDLQIDASHFHTPDDFTNVDFTIKKIRPINYDLRQVKHLQSDANLAIQKCVDTLLNFR